MRPQAAGGDGGRVDQLLEQLRLAPTYQQRQPHKRALYALGADALPRLDAVRAGDGDSDVKRLAASVASAIEARTARSKAAPVTGKALRARGELVVHGERIEIVEGREKPITPSFRLWLEIENLTDQDRTLSVPAIKAGPVQFPISRWYEEDTHGQPWTGVLRARTSARINVIGDIPGRLDPGTKIKATVELDALALPLTAEAQAVIHLRAP